MSTLKSPLLKLIKNHSTALWLILIMGIAIFFRFYQLHALPPGLHPDEAANGLDVFRILEQQDWRPLYNTNGPRESLFFFLQAASVLVFKNTIYALHFVPAVIGTLAVLVTFFWTRSWFGRRIALLASFLMAVTPWAVTMSRIGFRASMVPLFIPLTLWMYTLGLKTRRRKWFVLAGLSLGAGMYTYLSFRLFPLALLAVLGYLMVWRRDFIRPYYKLIWLSVAAFMIALLPMIAFGIKHPGDIGARTAGTSFLNPELNNGKPVQTFIDGVVKTALMFNVRGDENYRHNLGGQPMLNFFVGLMFLSGLVISFSRLLRPKYLALLAVFAVMLLPVVLTAEGLPHGLRAIGVMPVIFVFAALGISYWLDVWYSTFPINSAARATGWAMIGGLLAITFYQGYNQYFVAWAQSPETYKAYSEDAVAIGNFIKHNPTQAERFVVIDGYSDKTVEYLSHHHATYRRLDPHEIDRIAAEGKPKQFVIVHNMKEEAINRLKTRFAPARLTTHRSPFNNVELFSVYEVAK